MRRVGRGHLGEVAERPGAQREGQGSAPARLRPVALEEVLVGVGRVELDELDRAVFGQVAGQLARQVGLAGSRRPVEDDLLLFPEQVRDLRQFGLIHEQVSGELRGDRVEGKLASRWLGIDVGGWVVTPCGTRAAS